MKDTVTEAMSFNPFEDIEIMLSQNVSPTKQHFKFNLGLAKLAEE